MGAEPDVSIQRLLLSILVHFLGFGLREFHL